MADVVNIGKNAMDVRKSQLFSPYSKVIINVQSIDSGTVISYVAGNDTGLALEFDCPWGSQEMANNLLEKVRGYQYQPYNVTSAIINPAAEMGDAMQANGVYGGIYQQDATFTHTFYSDFSAPQDEQLDHEYTFETPIERRLSRQEAYAKATFQIQHDNIEARVTQKGGDIEDNSFSWRLLSNEFGLYSGSRKVFTCNKDGIIVKGTVYADAGLIGAKYNEQTHEWEGGFHIAEKKMWSGQSTYDGSASGDQDGVYVGTDGIGLGKGNFTVTKNGTFSAKKGTIGSDADEAERWQIGGKSIYKGTRSIVDTTEGTYLGTDGIRIYNDATKSFTFRASNGNLAFLGGMTGINDTTHTTGAYIGNDGMALGGGKFKVTSGGVLTAKEGVIGSDASAWNIGAKSIYNGTTSISDTDHQGTYVGIDGIRVYTDEKNSFTFNKNGTITVMKGMTGFDDTVNTSGFYFGTDGLVFGGGKLKLAKDGTLTAKKGVIGSDTNAWNIGAKSIFNGTESISDTKQGTYVGIDGIRIYNDEKNSFTFNKNGTIAVMKGMTSMSDTATSGFYFGNDGLVLGGGKLKLEKDGTLTAKQGVIGSSTDAWKIGAKSIYNGTESISDTDHQGTYVGTDGIRVFADAKNSFTFNKNGTLTIMKGMTSMSDTETSGFYFGNDGLVFGGGNLKLEKNGTLTAKKGVIGSSTEAWNIGTKSIYNGPESLSDTKQGTYVGTDGIRVYNDDKNSFTFNKNGTLTIMKGMTSISDTSNTSGFYFGNDGLVFGGGKLKLEKNGTLTAENATLNGTVRAKAGRIGAKENEDGSYTGGFEIKTDYIHSNKTGIDDTTNAEGIFLGINGIGLGRIGDGTPSDPYRTAFKVTKAGVLTAEGVTVKGTINATGGTFDNVTINSTATFKGKLQGATGDFSGKITAKEGIIGANASGTGGMTIAENKLYTGSKTAYDDDNTGVFIGNTGIGLGAKKFMVSSSGVLTAKDAELNGTIRAKAGRIAAKENGDGTYTGGFEIKTDYIHNNKPGIDDTSNAEGIFLGTNGIGLGRIGDNTPSNPYRTAFKVTKAGVLTAEGVTVKGTINATGGTFDNVTIKSSATFKGKLDGATGNFSGAITAKSGRIGNNTNAWDIGNDCIFNGTDSLISTTRGAYLGIEGIRIYNTDKSSFTFKKDGSLAIMKGMSSFDDSSANGMFIGDTGIALGGGKLKLSQDGTLTAKAGTIGNGDNPWNIGTDGFYRTKTSFDALSEGIYIGNAGIAMGQGPDEQHPSVFSVDRSGNLYARQGTFEGTIYASKLTFTNPDGTTTTIHGSNITDGSVGDGKISDVDGGKLVNGSVSGSGGTGGNGKIRSGTISKPDTNHGEQVTHGETAYNKVSGLIGGTEAFTYCKADKLWVSNQSGSTYGIWYGNHKYIEKYVQLGDGSYEYVLARASS